MPNAFRNLVAAFVLTVGGHTAVGEPLVAVDVNPATADLDTVDTISTSDVGVHIVLQGASAPSAFNVVFAYSPTFLGIRRIIPDDPDYDRTNILRDNASDSITWFWSHTDIAHGIAAIHGVRREPQRTSPAGDETLLGRVDFHYSYSGPAPVYPIFASFTDSTGHIDTVESLRGGSIVRYSTKASPPHGLTVSSSPLPRGFSLVNGRSIDPSRTTGLRVIVSPPPFQRIRANLAERRP